MSFLDFFRPQRRHTGLAGTQPGQEAEIERNRGYEPLGTTPMRRVDETGRPQGEVEFTEEPAPATRLPVRRPGRKARARPARRSRPSRAGARLTRPKRPKSKTTRPGRSPRRSVAKGSRRRATGRKTARRRSVRGGR